MVDQVLKNWETIYDQVPTNRIGNFEVTKDDGDVRLIEHSDSIVAWMGITTDTELNHYRRFYHLAKGNVLIAGVGLGLDLLSAKCSNKVDTIVVVEKERDVIDLVCPYIPYGKTSIVRDDIFSFLRYTDKIFDTIYFDIFPGGCESNPVPTNELRVLAQPRLATDGHLLFWYNL